MLIKFGDRRVKFDGKEWLSNGHWIMDWKFVQTCRFKISAQGKANKEIARRIYAGEAFQRGLLSDRLQAPDQSTTTLHEFAEDIRRGADTKLEFLDLTFESSSHTVFPDALYIAETAQGDRVGSINLEYYRMIQALQEQRETTLLCKGPVSPVLLCDKETGKLLFGVMPLRLREDQLREKVVRLHKALSK